MDGEKGPGLKMHKFLKTEILGDIPATTMLGNTRGYQDPQRGHKWFLKKSASKGVTNGHPLNVEESVSLLYVHYKKE